MMPTVGVAVGPLVTGMRVHVAVGDGVGLGDAVGVDVGVRVGVAKGDKVGVTSNGGMISSASPGASRARQRD